MHIFSATDSNFAQHLGVMLTSLLENAPDRSEINFHIIDGGIAPDQKENLNAIAKKYRINLDYLTPNIINKDDFHVSGYFTFAAYLRLFIPVLLDNSTEKAIYIDCDIIVKDDISALWNYDIADYYLAAIEDSNLTLWPEHKTSLGMPPESCYLNSGVLIFNLTKWRQDNILSKLIDFITGNPDKILFVDQDALNHLLWGKWLRLPLRWNQQPAHFDLLIYGDKRKAELREAVYNPGIIHFATGEKPWKYMCNHLLRSEYFKYIKLTPWHHFIPADRTFKNVVLKTLKNLWVPIKRYERIVRHRFRRRASGDGPITTPAQKSE